MKYLPSARALQYSAPPGAEPTAVRQSNARISTAIPNHARYSLPAPKKFNSTENVQHRLND